MSLLSPNLSASVALLSDRIGARYRRLKILLNDKGQSFQSKVLDSTTSNLNIDLFSPLYTIKVLDSIASMAVRGRFL